MVRKEQTCYAPTNPASVQFLCAVLFALLDIFNSRPEKRSRQFRKTMVPGQHEESSRKWFEKMRFRSALNLGNQVRVEAKARFSVFNPSLQFRNGFGLSFWSFVDSIRRKQGFQECLKIAWFLNRFLKHFGPPKMDQKSIKIDPRGYLGPRWIQGGVILSQHGSKNRV